jgi:hypothetical protein
VDFSCLEGCEVADARISCVMKKGVDAFLEESC